MEKFIAKSEAFNNSRELVKYVNLYNISRDNVLTIFKEGEMLILVYYGRE